MRRFAFIIIFVVGTAAGIQWLGQGYSATWEPLLRTYLEQTASKATQSQVSIDSITPSFFHRIRLMNVRAFEPEDHSKPIFRASEIELTISLIDLPRAIYRRHAYEAIGLVTVKEPWLRLSQAALDKRVGRRTTSAALPPWFTVVWNGGSLQWVTPRAPKGAWTLYQAQGVFRIRGPQITLAVRGSIQEAQSVRFEFHRLGQRWNAQMRVAEGRSESLIALAALLKKRPFLPPTWSVPGLFHLEAKAGGRRMPARGDDWMSYLEEAELSFLPTSEKEGQTSPALHVSGTLTYAQGKVTSPKLSLDCPWFQSTGRVEFSFQRVSPKPDLTLSADLSAGRLLRWPFQSAVIRARYVNDHWEFPDNTLHIMDGQISAKGYAAPVDSDLAITADNIALSALTQTKDVKNFQGRLNASCTLRGPLDHWQISGGWWLVGGQWGPTALDDARGDFEITTDHFQAEAKTENSQFRFLTEGSLSDDEATLDQFEVFLPTGATFIAGGRWNRTTGQVHGTFDGTHLTFPDDLPFLAIDRIAVKGPLEVHGRVSGAVNDPVVKGAVSSSNLSVGGQVLGKSAATFAWSRGAFEIPSLHVDPGLDGRYSNGDGSLKVHQMTFGKWPVSDAGLHFKVEPGQLVLNECSFKMKEAALHLTGKASWKKDQHPVASISLEGAGTISSAADPNVWSIPFSLSGESTAGRDGWEGRAKVNAPSPLWQKVAVESMGAVVSWTPQGMSWSDAHWGRHWDSEGSVRLDQKPAVWSGRVKATHVDLDEWQPLLWPDIKSELHGILDGTFQLTGATDQTEGDLSVHLGGGHWRAFQMTTDLTGHWGPQGIKPLTVDGHFKNGGRFQFSGLVAPDKQIQGTMTLSSFDLQPLGESLHFPKSLNGITSATLTLAGPLSRLTCSGHLEGGPVTYAAESDHPFKLENVTMDMTLAPSDSDPTIAHLTLTEAHAKTAEELVRFQSGSYVEFSGQKPARLHLGTDIRNLHLGIFTLFGGLDLDGTWQIKPDGFSIQTKAQTHSLFINDYEMQEGVVLADYYNGILKFSAPPKMPSFVTGTIDFHKAPQLKFTDFYISGQNLDRLQLSGDIGPSLWDFQMVGQSLDMGILAELAGFVYPMSGSADVQVRGTGDTKHPHVDGKITLDRGTVMGLSFRTGNASFVWQDARITFNKLVLSDAAHYSLEGAGSFPLISKGKTETPDHTIDFSIRLKDSNLSLLQSFSKEVKDAKGPVDGLLQIKGTLEAPSLHGSIHVANGNVVGAHYFRELRNAYLSLDFDGDKVLIRDFRGKSGQGEFRGSGSVTLAGFQPSFYDVNLDVVSSKGLEVQIPELAIPESPLAKRFQFLTTSSRCDVRGHVSLHGPAESPAFGGTGIFSNGHFTFPPSRKQPPSPAIMEWFHRISWDVDLRFQDGAWFDNELIQANVVGNLKLKGPSDKFRVDGGLDIIEGKISYLGLQFDLTEAHYDVRSEVSGDSIINTPYLRGVAESQIQAVDTVSGVAGSSGGSRLSVNDTITLTIDYAPIDQIRPRLTSAANPTLSQDKLLARVTQTDMENLTPQERTYLYQKQILSLIDNSLTTPLAQNVLKKTGIADRVRVQHVYDPNTATGQDLNTAAATQQQQSAATNIFANSKYTIEKDLSNRLSLGYGIRFIPSVSTDPDLQQQQGQKLDLISDIQLSYHWFKNVYLKGDFDLPTSNPSILPERKVTIEPRWRFGWWGNTNKDKEPPKSSN